MLVRMLISKGFACRESEDGIEGLSELSRMYLRKSKTSDAPPAFDTPSVAPARFSLCRMGSPPEQEEGGKERQEQHQFTIDAVLIDSNMPRMNGPEAIVEMRKLGFRGPIIGVSGGEEETMKQFLKAGADNVMQKPAQSDKLVNMLLTGLQLVVQEASSRDLLQGGKDGNARSSQKGRVDHIKRLKKFIEETDAKINK